KIARYTGDPRIGHLPEPIMDAVAELVQQGCGIVEADKCRHSLSALGAIIVVRGKNKAFAAERLLAAIGGHPRARAFSIAREIVEIEKAHILARLEVENLERPHLGVEDGNSAGIFLEAEVVELARRPKHGVDELVELEV